MPTLESRWVPEVVEDPQRGRIWRAQHVDVVDEFIAEQNRPVHAIGAVVGDRDERKASPIVWRTDDEQRLVRLENVSPFIDDVQSFQFAVERAKRLGEAPDYRGSGRAFGRRLRTHDGVDYRAVEPSRAGTATQSHGRERAVVYR